MNGSRYSSAILKIVLTDFLGARVEKIMNENGNYEEFVCIPVNRNGLRIGRTGKVSAYGFVSKTRNANLNEWTHYIKLKCKPEFVAKLDSLGYKVPYIGNLKPSNYIVYKNNYNEALRNAKVPVITDEEDEDNEE